MWGQWCVCGGWVHRVSASTSNTESQRFLHEQGGRALEITQLSLRWEY